MASSPRPLPPADVETRLRAQYGEDILDFQDQFGHAAATITPQRYREVATFLRDDPALDLDYFDFTGGVDFGDDGMQVVTHLYSTTHHHHVRLKVRLAKDEMTCPTLSDIYPGANWHEREATEMFGIAFEGHPQPVKLLLSEEFEGNPLRKDFPLMTREAKIWPGDQEIED
ncbi:MAG: NADH-quinone oxidoreductase subunit C [Actinomycetota bacterium]